MITDRPDTFWQRRGQAMSDAGTCIVCLHPTTAHALGCRHARIGERGVANTFDEIPSTTPHREPTP